MEISVNEGVSILESISVMVDCKFNVSDTITIAELISISLTGVAVARIKKGLLLGVYN